MLINKSFLEKINKWKSYTSFERGLGAPLLNFNSFF